MDLSTLLDTIAHGPVAGTVLAHRFDVSRAMVWKGVEALRAEGNTIEADHLGYRLESVEGFGPATLRWRCGRPVHYVHSCDSTNRIARERAAEGAPSGALVVADEQTQGRGRQGRTWTSAQGLDLTFSLVLRPAVAPQRSARCVLAWAGAMARALDVYLKWPNDLVTEDGQKIGGVLAEMQSEGERVRHIILGVGINVNRRDFQGLDNATSLVLIDGCIRDRGTVLAALVHAIDDVDPVTDVGLSIWRRRCTTLGKRVRVAGISGVATDIRDDGALMVDGQPVLAGDVQLVEG